MLVRPTSDSPRGLPLDHETELVVGDCREEASLDRLLEGAGRPGFTVAGIGTAENVIAACKRLFQ